MTGIISPQESRGGREEAPLLVPVAFVTPAVEEVPVLVYLKFASPSSKPKSLKEKEVVPTLS